MRIKGILFLTSFILLGACFLFWPPEASAQQRNDVVIALHSRQDYGGDRQLLYGPVPVLHQLDISVPRPWRSRVSSVHLVQPNTAAILFKGNNDWIFIDQSVNRLHAGANDNVHRIQVVPYDKSEWVSDVDVRWVISNTPAPSADRWHHIDLRHRERVFGRVPFDSGRLRHQRHRVGAITTGERVLVLEHLFIWDNKSSGRAFWRSRSSDVWVSIHHPIREVLLNKFKVPGPVRVAYRGRGHTLTLTAEAFANYTGVKYSYLGLVDLSEHPDIDEAIRVSIYVPTRLGRDDYFMEKEYVSVKSASQMNTQFGWFGFGIRNLNRTKYRSHPQPRPHFPQDDPPDLIPDRDPFR